MYAGKKGMDRKKGMDLDMHVEKMMPIGKMGACLNQPSGHMT